jgi:hypothetical protein
MTLPVAMNFWMQAKQTTQKSRTRPRMPEDEKFWHGKKSLDLLKFLSADLRDIRAGEWATINKNSPCGFNPPAKQVLN